MTEKIVWNPIDPELAAAILTPLVEIGKLLLQSGYDLSGRPVTAEDFAIVNRARAARDKFKRQGG